jgi:hypothetical protein
LIDAQAELGEFQRQVALDAGPGDRVDHSQVVLGRGVGFCHAGHAFAEIVEGLEQSLGLGRPRGGDRFLDPLPGDEAAGEAARLAHAVAGREVLQRRAARQQVEERLGRGVEHRP